MDRKLVKLTTIGLDPEDVLEYINGTPETIQQKLENLVLQCTSKNLKVKSSKFEYDGGEVLLHLYREESDAEYNGRIEKEMVKQESKLEKEIKLLKKLKEKYPDVGGN
jgi:hypothetical protein